MWETYARITRQAHAEQPRAMTHPCTQEADVLPQRETAATSISWSGALVLCASSMHRLQMWMLNWSTWSLWIHEVGHSRILLQNVHFHFALFLSLPKRTRELESKGFGIQHWAQSNHVNRGLHRRLIHPSDPGHEPESKRLLITPVTELSCMQLKVFPMFISQAYLMGCYNGAKLTLPLPGLCHTAKCSAILKKVHEKMRMGEGIRKKLI